MTSEREAIRKRAEAIRALERGASLGLPQPEESGSSSPPGLSRR